MKKIKMSLIALAVIFILIGFISLQMSLATHAAPTLGIGIVAAGFVLFVIALVIKSDSTKK